MSPSSDQYYRWRPHPWHGLEVGPEPPNIVTAYIEITPFDLVKYEVDKSTGYLRIDRPQRTSSTPPTLYGFIPRTYCGQRVGALAPGAERGDGDPLDICVISERQVERAEIILNALVIGGLQMIDHDQADDKIIAVLQNDPIWGGAQGIADLPPALIDRLRHYFLTYKMKPGVDLNDHQSQVRIAQIYDRDQAHAVIRASMEDYQEKFGE